MTVVLRYALPGAIFGVGAATMALEIFGFGILAPHFGLSLQTSSFLIGIIMGGLALGYILGGIFAHTLVSTFGLSRVLLLIACYIGIVFALKDTIGAFIRWNVNDVILGTFGTTVLLFAPLNILLGAVLPLAVQLSIRAENATAGRKTASLYMLSTVGSIFGTFVTGFVLIPFSDMQVSLSSIAVLFILCAVLLDNTQKWWLLSIPFILLFPQFAHDHLAYTPNYPNVHLSLDDGNMLFDRSKLKVIDDVFSQYSRIRIYEGIEQKTQKKSRLMEVNRELHTGAYLDSNELMFNYARFNRLGGHFNTSAKKALLLGGGGYSYAKYFLGDTPLYARDKQWDIEGDRYGNDGKLTVPILLTNDVSQIGNEATLVYQREEYLRDSEHEEDVNVLSATYQKPGNSVYADHINIQDTGIPGNMGYVHIHETKEDGRPGDIISPDYYLHTPRELIGHSGVLTGEHDDVHIILDRATKDGEVVYLMLHRDNGNQRFDNLIVDAYSKLESLDVVEIDPKTTELAVKYFNLNLEDPRLTIFHEDGRTFLNRATEKYDIIYFDAFRTFYAAPFQLTTKEAMEEVYRLLNPNGVAVFNFPTALTGEYGQFFQAELKTLHEVFPHLKVYAATSPRLTSQIQNIIVVGFQSADSVRSWPSDNAELNEILTHEWKQEIDPNVPVLTDEYAPVEYLIAPLAKLVK